MYELIIIGGGPAGCAAAVYAARKKMKTLMITKDFGGQSTVSTDIGNWIGEVVISGIDLAKKFELHVRAQEDITINIDELVESVVIKKEGDYPVYTVKTNKGEYDTLSIVFASGGRRRKLNVLGEKEFDGRGVVYCSTCDAPLFNGRDVVVVGTGNAGLEAIIDLIPYAKTITLLNRSEEIRGDAVTAEIAMESEKVTHMKNVEIIEIKGQGLVTSVVIKDTNTNEIQELSTQGVFVEIGSIPNSEALRNIVEMNDRGEVIVDMMTFKTSRRGIFAAGDVTQQIYKQNNISAGNAVSATLSAYDYIVKCRKAMK